MKIELPICRNPRCNETLNIWSGARLCPACRYLARRAFAAGAFIAGVVWGIVQILSAFGGVGK